MSKYEIGGHRYIRKEKIGKVEHEPLNNIKPIKRGWRDGIIKKKEASK